MVPSLTKTNIMMRTAKFVLATIVLVGSLILTSKNSQELSEKETEILNRLKQKGYRDVILGKTVPSSDDSTVKQFEALSPHGELVYGVALLWRDDLRVYPR